MPENAALPPIALYIHWPFCKSKCPYCDFNSHVRERIPEQDFRAALLTEIETLAARVSGRRLVSIFFGGGTPSLMSPETVHALIEKAMALFHVGDASTLEITLEANPTSVEAAKFRGFREAGVNRVSLGVQSLNEASLKFLGREHSAEEALEAVKLAADIFPRYSFDLIYALPGQTPEAWKKELKEALAYAGDHLSLYQLTIEENTAFHHAYHEKKAFQLPVDHHAAALYELTQEIMDAQGLPAYEISNHAKPGQESRHNLTYWLGEEYLGIGPGAHGRLFVLPPGSSTDSPMGHRSAGSRLAQPTASHHAENKIASPPHPPACGGNNGKSAVNGGNNGKSVRGVMGWYATACIKSPERWLEQVQQRGHGLETDQPLTARERMEEYWLMRLRLHRPMACDAFPLAPDHPLMRLLLKEGLIAYRDEAFTLTPRGRLVSQALTGELLAAMR